MNHPHCSSNNPCFQESCKECVAKVLAETPLKQFSELDALGVRFTTVAMAHARRTFKYRNVKLPESDCGWCWKCDKCFKHIKSKKNQYIPYYALDYFRTTGAPSIPLNSNKIPSIPAFADWYHPQYKPTEDEVNLAFYVAVYKEENYIGYATLFQNILCLDFDKESGVEVAKQLWPDYPGTTASGKGAHYFFKPTWDLGKFPVAHMIRTNIHYNDLIAETVDVKTYRSYAVGPESYHAGKKKRYKSGVAGKPWWRQELLSINNNLSIEIPESNRRNDSGDIVGTIKPFPPRTLSSILEKGITTKEVRKRILSTQDSTPFVPTTVNQDAVTRRATKYLQNCPGAVSGEGGDNRTFSIACVLVNDFALDADTALSLMMEWNNKCVPPWEVSDLQTKLDNAKKHSDPTRYGCKAKEIEYPYRPITPPKKTKKVIQKSEKRSTPSSRPNVEITTAPHIQTANIIGDFDIKIPSTYLVFKLEKNASREPSCLDYDDSEIEDVTPTKLSLFINETIDSRWLWTPTSCREPGEDEFEPIEVITVDDDEEEGEEYEQKLDDELVVPAAPPKPKIKWEGLDYKTQKYLLEFGKKHKDEFSAFVIARLAEGSEKPKKDKTAKGVEKSWVKCFTCGTMVHKCKTADCDCKSKRFIFCERHSVCVYCAKSIGKYFKLWAERFWKDEWVTIVERKFDLKPQTRFDVQYEQRYIKSNFLNPAKVSKCAWRFLESNTRAVYVGKGEIYEGLRKKFKPQLKEWGLFGPQQFSLDAITTVRIMKKKDALDLLFDDMWVEPAKAFRKMCEELSKVVHDEEWDHIELKEKLALKILKFPFMDGWHVSRTLPNKAGNKQDAFHLPNKKELREFIRQVRIEEDPGLAEVKPGHCRTHGNKYDNGAVYYGRDKILDISPNIEERYKVNQLANDTALAFAYALQDENMTPGRYSKHIIDESNKPFAVPGKPGTFHFKPKACNATAA